MGYREDDFLKAIEASFKAYKKTGARSTEKLKPIHKFVAETLSDIFGGGYSLHYMCNDNKEKKVEGKYYPKDIDVTVTKNDKPVFCLGIKFVTSNYKQNANNYFESMMGETANIQSLGNLPYAQLIILRHLTPYYLKNDSVLPSKIETIKDKDVSKYMRLMYDQPQAHRPNNLGILLVDIDEPSGSVSATDLGKSFSEEIVKCLSGKFSLTKFFDEISEYRDYLNTRK